MISDIVAIKILVVNNNAHICTRKYVWMYAETYKCRRAAKYMPHFLINIFTFYLLKFIEISNYNSLFTIGLKHNMGNFTEI